MKRLPFSAAWLCFFAGALFAPAIAQIPAFSGSETFSPFGSHFSPDDPAVLSETEIQALPREAEVFLGDAFKHSKFDTLIDIHLYHLPETVPVRLQWLKQQLQKYQFEKDIILTETAGPDLRVYGGVPPWPVDEQFKIQQAARRVLFPPLIFLKLSVGFFNQRGRKNLLCL